MPYPLGYGGFLCCKVSEIKRNSYAFFSDSSDVVAQETRRRRLEKFLARVARHPLLGATKIFNEFLTVNDDKVHPCSLYWWLTF